MGERKPGIGTAQQSANMYENRNRYGGRGRMVGAADRAASDMSGKNCGQLPTCQVAVICNLGCFMCDRR